MSTSLVKANAGQLTEIEQAVLSEMDAEGQAGYEFLPERIKFSAGGLLAFQLTDGSMLPAPVEAIVIVAQRTRGYWPSKETAGLPPLCASRDGVWGTFNAGSDQVREALRIECTHPALFQMDAAKAVGPWECASCPLQEWGSAPNNSRACKYMRKLAILVRGWQAPAVLTLPPTSASVWDGFVSGRRNRGKAYFDSWVNIGLGVETNKSGIKYAKLTLTAGAALNEGELAEVIGLRHQYVELVRAMNVTADDYEVYPEGTTVGSADDDETPF